MPFVAAFRATFKFTYLSAVGYADYPADCPTDLFAHHGAVNSTDCKAIFTAVCCSDSCTIVSTEFPTKCYSYKVAIRAAVCSTLL